MFLVFSKEINNILMWSHYANGHRGVAFEFERTKFSDRARDISYPKDNTRLTFKSYLYGKEMEIQHTDIIYTKSPHWEYEQEVRVLGGINEGPERPIIKITNDNGNINYFCKMKRDTIKSIYFGLEILNKDKDQIIGCINKQQPHIQVHQMKRHTKKFKVIPHPIENK